MKNDRKFDIPRAVKQNPQLAAVVSKLVSPVGQSMLVRNGKLSPTLPQTFELRNMAMSTAASIRDADTIMKLLPDIEASRQILISSIISPKGPNTEEVIYSSEMKLMPANVSFAILAKIKEYFNTVYKIGPLLYEMCDESLFRTGSYPLVVIPEASVDEMINGELKLSMESLHMAETADKEMKKYIGLISRGPNVAAKQTGTLNYAIEALREAIMPAAGSDFDPSIESDTSISVYDNPQLLKSPILAQRLNNYLTAVKTFGKDSFVTESYAAESISDSAFMSGLYKSATAGGESVRYVKTAEQLSRESIGRPLIMRLPSESVIPVSMIGDPKNIIGAYVLLDQAGYPISSRGNVDYFNSMGANLAGMSSGGTLGGKILDKVNQQMGNLDASSMSASNQRLRALMIQRAYSEFVELDLANRLKNGSYGEGYALSRNDEVYRLMLARSLSGQNTQVLFIPKQLLTYVAFDYTDMGIGKTLLEDMKMNLGLRVALRFANVMTALNNSVTRKNVVIKFDPEDPDPYDTISKVEHEIVTANQGSIFPAGTISPALITDWLARSSYHFTFENHPGIPDLNIDFNEHQSNYIKVDTELEEMMRDDTTMGLGVPPELVSMSRQPEFATTAMFNNTLFVKRAVQLQKTLMEFVTMHVKNIIPNDRMLLEQIKDVIRQNLDLVVDAHPLIKKIPKEKRDSNLIINRLAMQFIDSLVLSLPEPLSKTTQEQMEAFSAYKDGLVEMLESIISDNLFTEEVAGKANVYAAEFRNAVVAKELMRWANDHGMFSDIMTAISNPDANHDKIDPAAREAADFTSFITKSLAQFGIRLKDVIRVSDKALEDFDKALGGDGETENSATTSTSTGGDSSNPDEPVTPGDSTPTEDNPTGEEGGTPGEDQPPTDDGMSDFDFDKF